MRTNYHSMAATTSVYSMSLGTSCGETMDDRRRNLNVLRAIGIPSIHLLDDAQRILGDGVRAELKWRHRPPPPQPTMTTIGQKQDHLSATVPSTSTRAIGDVARAMATTLHRNTFLSSVLLSPDWSSTVHIVKSEEEEEQLHHHDNAATALCVSALATAFQLVGDDAGADPSYLSHTATTTSEALMKRHQEEQRLLYWASGLVLFMKRFPFCWSGAVKAAPSRESSSTTTPQPTMEIRFECQDNDKSVAIKLCRRSFSVETFFDNLLHDDANHEHELHATNKPAVPLSSHLMDLVSHCLCAPQHTLEYKGHLVNIFLAVSQLWQLLKRPTASFFASSTTPSHATQSATGRAMEWLRSEAIQVVATAGTEVSRNVAMLLDHQLARCERDNVGSSDHKMAAVKAWIETLVFETCFSLAEYLAQELCVCVKSASAKQSATPFHKTVQTLQFLAPPPTLSTSTSCPAENHHPQLPAQVFSSEIAAWNHWLKNGGQQGEAHHMLALHTPQVTIDFENTTRHVPALTSNNNEEEKKVDVASILTELNQPKTVVSERPKHKAATPCRLLTFQEFLAAFGSIVLLPPPPQRGISPELTRFNPSMNLQDVSLYEEPLRSWTQIRLILLRSGLKYHNKATSTAEGAQEDVHIDPTTYLIEINSLAPLGILHKKLSEAKDIAIRTLQKACFTRLASAWCQRKLRFKLSKKLRIIHMFARAKSSELTLHARAKENFVAHRTEAILQRKRLYHARKIAAEAREGPSLPSDHFREVMALRETNSLQPEQLFETEVIRQRQVKHLMKMEEVHRDILLDEWNSSFEQHISAPFTKRFPTASIVRAEDDQRAIVAELALRGLRGFLAHQESDLRRIAQVEFMRKWKSHALAFHVGLQQQLFVQESRMRHSVEALERHAFFTLKEGVSINVAMEEVYQWVESARNQSTNMQSLQMQMGRSRIPRRAFAHGEDYDEGDEDDPAAYDDQLLIFRKFAKDQEKIFLSLHMDKQDLLSAEANHRHQIQQLFARELVFKQWEDGFLKLLKVEKKRRWQLWIDHRFTALRHKEMLRRFYMSSYAALQLQSYYKRHRIELEELHMRRMILNVGLQERQAITKDLHRWEAVFNDTYSSPSRLIQTWKEEQQSVKRLLQAVSTAELHAAAVSSGVVHGGAVPSLLYGEGARSSPRRQASPKKMARSPPRRPYDQPQTRSRDPSPSSLPSYMRPTSATRAKGGSPFRYRALPSAAAPPQPAARVGRSSPVSSRHPSRTASVHAPSGTSSTGVHDRLYMTSRHTLTAPSGIHDGSRMSPSRQVEPNAHLNAPNPRWR